MMKTSSHTDKIERGSKGCGGINVQDGASMGKQRTGRQILKPLGIYVHVPFCVSKCGYCGFYSHRGNSEDYEDYTQNTVRFVENLHDMGNIPFEWGSFYVDSIFFGGGTPSILPPSHIEKILGSIYQKFDIKEDVEITIEANPGTLTIDKLDYYKKLGINRLSLGVQSFNDKELKFIGRIHDSQTAKDTFKQCRKAGFDNINLDLIFSLPEQKLEGWKKNLEEAAVLLPDHLSVYGLQLEEGTEFFRIFQQGEFSETSDELDRRMYHWTCDYLRRMGFEHYEISNWSKPGFECRHNLKYWNFQDYLGVGPSAASFVEGRRFSMDEGWNIVDIHVNDLMDSAGEFSFTSLRTSEGIDFKRFENEVGEPFWSVYGKQREEIEGLSNEGLVTLDNKGIRLTEKGIDISNRIMTVFI